MGFKSKPPLWQKLIKWPFLIIDGLLTLFTIFIGIKLPTAEGLGVIGLALLFAALLLATLTLNSIIFVGWLVNYIRKKRKYKHLLAPVTDVYDINPDDDID